MKLGIGFVSAPGSRGTTSEHYMYSRRTTRDEKMTIVIRSEKRVATRARPKMDGILSVFSLTPS